MKTIFQLFLVSIVFYCCTTTTKTEREGEPEIYTVEDEDAEMNAAIKTANETLDIFKVALERNDENYSAFSIKQKFDTSDGGEHIWLSGVVLKEGDYYGIVDNEPELTDEVHLGDTIKISPAQISDWMYIDQQRVKGGYTLRLLRERMSEEEREQFDAETGLLFE